MKTLIFLLALLTCPAHAIAQDLASLTWTPMSVAAPATTTNVQFVGSGVIGAGAGSVTTGPITYTCASTANRLVLITEWLNSSVGSLPLTDTGGKASTATTLLAATVEGTETFKAWNVGCTTTSNTLTVTSSTASGYRSMVLEYSGLGSGGDAAAAWVSTGTVSTVSISATPATNGDLAVAYIVGSGNTHSDNSWFGTTRGYSETATNNGGGRSVTAWDNHYTLSGSQTFTSSFNGPDTAWGVYLFIPGTSISGTHTTFTPFLAQWNGNCGTSASNMALPGNVVAGDLLTALVSSSSAATFVVSDTKGNTWTQQKYQASGTASSVALYTAIANSSGADTLVYSTSTGTTNPCSIIAEWGSVGDTVSDTAGANPTTQPFTWTMSVSNNPSFIIGGAGLPRNGNSQTVPGSGYVPVSVSGVSSASVLTWKPVYATGSTSVTLNDFATSTGSFVSVATH